MPPYNWALLADLTNDGTVDFQGFAHQAKDNQSTGNEKFGDLNRDGCVDMKDVALLTVDWLLETSWHSP
jgi:hypothetical protein